MEKPSLTNWSALILSVLLAAVGIAAIATRRIGSSKPDGIYVAGNAATAIGLVAIIVGLMISIAWIRKRRRR